MLKKLKIFFTYKQKEILNLQDKYFKIIESLKKYGDSYLIIRKYDFVSAVINQLKDFLSIEVGENNK